MFPNEPPSGWGEDSLARFVDNTRHNVFASYVKLPARYRRLADIDAGFRLIVENLKNPNDWSVPLFLLRAHSSFLGGAHLALAGQLPESYMLLRGSVENAVYAFYFHRVPASHERWLRRHDSDKAKKIVQEEFRIAALLRFLKRSDERLGAIGDKLYQRTIDFGGHPNERALTQILKLTQEQAERQFRLAYLSGHTSAMDLCLKTAAQVGVLGLKVFQRIFPERYDLLGLSERLRALQDGL